MIIDFFTGLRRAFKYRLVDHRNIEMPDVAAGRKMSEKRAKRITSIVSAGVAFLMFGKYGRCFYRSYTVAYILRKRGFDVRLNFGAKNLFGGDRDRGHCWLSYEGKPFCELDDVENDFPVLMHESKNGINHYINDK